MWVRTWAQRRMRRLAERYQWVVADSIRHHGRAAPGATARGAPHPPKAPPTPRLARNFFIKAPSPYAAYFFVFGP